MDYAVIVDLETTGLDSKKDRIIEIGIMEFGVKSGAVPTITKAYGGLEDPKIDIPEEITKITGLSSFHVEHQKIDWEIVKQMLERAVVIIAHNMEFDRSFLLQRPELKEALRGKHWACSMNHINWKKHGFKSQALTYLAADHGFVNPFPHRALFDCATTFKLLVPHLDEMLKRSYERQFMIKAFGAPFDQKDKLKERGYRWDGAERVWSKMLGESEMAEERDFLGRDIYQGSPRHEETEILAGEA